jgi:hypothetical protein
MILPNNWSSIPLWKYQDLIKVDMCSDKTIYDKYVEYLQILADIEYEDIEDMDVLEVSNIIKTMSWLKTSPNSTPKVELYDFKLIDINTILLGEYIDIQNFKADIISNLHLITAILYKKYKLDEFSNIHFEKYSDIDLYKRSEIFLDSDINDIYPVLSIIKEFDNYINNNYSNIFSKTQQELDDDGEDYILTPKEKIELLKEKEKEKFSWEKLIDDLSGSDITKKIDILSLPLIFVLNDISFRKLFNS